MRDAQGLGGERRHERIIEPEHQGDPANNLIAVGHPVKGADAMGRILELGQVLAGGIEFLQERSWIVAAKGEACFGCQCRACALSQDDR